MSLEDLKNVGINKNGLLSSQQVKVQCKKAVKAYIDCSKEKKRLNELDIARVFQNVFSYCLFNDEENSRVAVYMPERGIYTQNYMLIKRYISYIAPYLNNAQKNEVISKLWFDAPIKEPSKESNWVAVNNGLFNLAEKQLYPFSSEHVVTTKIKTDYVENASAPNIDGWTVDGMYDTLADGDKEITKLLWQVTADIMEPNKTRNKSIWLVGTMRGNNGKSTLEKAWMEVVGKNNYAEMTIDEFDQRFRLKSAVGVPLIIGDDVQNKFIEKSENFNRVVTGDPVYVEAKGVDGFTTELNCTVVQSCNIMPIFKKQGGTERRLLLVPFNHYFKGSNENISVKQDYLERKEVREYILYKALNEYGEFEDYDIPRASKELMAKFKKENDSVVAFKTDIFDKGNFERIQKTVVFNWYINYCKKNGYKNHIQKRSWFFECFDGLIEDQYEVQSKKLKQVQISHLKEFNQQCIDNELGGFYLNVKWDNSTSCYVKKI